MQRNPKKINWNQTDLFVIFIQFKTMTPLKKFGKLHYVLGSTHIKCFAVYVL